VNQLAPHLCSLDVGYRSPPHAAADVLSLSCLLFLLLKKPLLLLLLMPLVLLLLLMVLLLQ
jgi:hypothetical protein